MKYEICPTDLNRRPSDLEQWADTNKLPFSEHIQQGCSFAEISSCVGLLKGSFHSRTFSGPESRWLANRTRRAALRNTDWHCQKERASTTQCVWGKRIALLRDCRLISTVTTPHRCTACHILTKIRKVDETFCTVFRKTVSCLEENVYIFVFKCLGLKKGFPFGFIQYCIVYVIQLIHGFQLFKRNRLFTDCSKTDWFIFLGKKYMN